MAKKWSIQPWFPLFRAAKVRDDAIPTRFSPQMNVNNTETRTYGVS
jgi:hypothetical protein